MLPVTSRRVRLVLSLGLALTATFAIALAPCPVQAQQTPTAPRTAALPALTTEVAFPNLKFDRPVALAYPDDEQPAVRRRAAPGDDLVVPQREGHQRQAASSSSCPTRSTGATRRGCSAWRSIPKYKENGEFFVYYSANDRGRAAARSSRGSRSRKDDPRKADPASEERVWVVGQGPVREPQRRLHRVRPRRLPVHLPGRQRRGGRPAQDRPEPERLVRLDPPDRRRPPRRRQAYGIPADNPARRSQAFAHWAPEVYCIGLRNVWKFTFDRATGTLWAGDVGQNLWEMVHIIQNGGNYGWSIKEGFHPFEPQRRQKADPASPITPPLVEYPHAPTTRAPRRRQEHHRRLRLPRQGPARAGRRLRLRRLRHRPDLGPPRAGRQGRRQRRADRPSSARRSSTSPPSAKTPRASSTSSPSTAASISFARRK